MGEVIYFIPRHERERNRLIREARAIYDSVFPSAAPTRAQSHEASSDDASARAEVHAYPSKGMLS
jgi:hypothetical protein